MAKAKLSPRQRMINMMYIVLIALLALNVDKQVLDAFHHMEKNFVSSVESYNEKNLNQMHFFGQMLEKDEAKTKPFYDSALVAQRLSKELVEYIDAVKFDIEEMYDGRLEPENGATGLMSMRTPEGMEAHAHYFMIENNGQRSKDLQNKINATRDRLLSLLNPAVNPNIIKPNSYRLVKNSNLLQADEPAQNGVSKTSWATTNLEYQPAGALLALLTQYQNNAKALESDVVDQLYQKVNEDGVVFNQFDAQILAKSNYVMEGENFEADVLLVASNSTSNPIIKLNGSDLPTVERGVGKVSIPARGVGLKTVKGEIILEDPLTGKPTSYAFEKEYQVFKPVATISADKLNLLYIGIDNPLSISVPGFSAADITVKATSGGSFSGGNGKYNIKVAPGTRKVDISVMAKGRIMGSTQYRVRNVPKPRGQLGGLTRTNVTYDPNIVAAQDRVLASLGLDFAYDMNFVVRKFTIILMHNNKPVTKRIVNGNAIPADIKTAIRRMRKGEKVIIEGISAKDTKYGIVKNNIDNVIITIR